MKRTRRKAVGRD